MGACGAKTSSNTNHRYSHHLSHCVQVLRLEPHCVISNRTGTPLQIMHYSPSNKLQRLGAKASGVQPPPGKQPSRNPPGLKGVVADPQQDWTSCIDVPVGAIMPFFCACKHSLTGIGAIDVPLQVETHTQMIVQRSGQHVYMPESMTVVCAINQLCNQM